MSPISFSFLAAFCVVLAYWPIRNPRDPVGWWLGLGHGVLAIVAVSGWNASQDAGFATAMAILAAYAGAMSAAELVRLLRERSPLQP